MKKRKKRIEQICSKCAKKRGAKIPKGHVYSCWTDKCDICGKEVEVTSPFDFGLSENI